MRTGWASCRGTRTGPPAPFFGRFPARWTPPVAGEADEVVEPHDIHLRQRGAEAIDPPGISLSGERLPAVQRITPQLARFGDHVGRHAGHDGRPALLVEEE